MEKASPQQLARRTIALVLAGLFVVARTAGRGRPGR